ncbi:oxidoreductase [Bryobacterales bacterium F-183]|nr:oxidoreductase [Bryobacterales bacterium F-183]
MQRRGFLAGLGASSSLFAQTGAELPKVSFGRTGVRVSRIAQGGARMDLHPDVATAAAYVRKVYELGITYFDCARLYWDGKAEEAYGIGLQGVRKNVFLTTKSPKRTAKGAMEDLEISLRLLKTDYVDLWQIHAVQDRKDIDGILSPGGALEAFLAAKKAGKCRFIGFTGHFDPAAHTALLKAYGEWDTVMLPVHAADRSYLSFEADPLPVAAEKGIGVQAIKVFGKAHLLRSLSPSDCLRYALSQPGVHVAICGAATQGQMEDNIRVASAFRPMGAYEIADVRKRAGTGAGVVTGPGLEYWKKRV